jgi:hypothetical protein
MIDRTHVLPAVPDSPTGPPYGLPTTLRQETLPDFAFDASKAKAFGVIGLRWLSISGSVAATALLLGLAYFVIDQRPYQAGDDLGYNLGLGGGVLMLTLLVYPLRKRLPSMNAWGGMRTWFFFHMLAGIVGPALIIFHSTFRLGSMNARVALYSMLLVTVSGIAGRFIYRHTNEGLYGRRITLAEKEAELEQRTGDVATLVHMAPQVATQLNAFRELAMGDLSKAAGARLWSFLTLGYRARIAKRIALQLLDRALQETALDRPQVILTQSRQEARDEVTSYIDVVRATAEFAEWDRLFSLWHVMHIPSVYLLVLCGGIHIFAVHTY